MIQWPWLTAIVTGILAISPLGRDIFYAAFLSSDPWMQDFWRFVLLSGAASLVLLAVTEWGIRENIVRRRAAANGAPGAQKTET